MSTVPFQLMWGPGLIGFVIGLALFGVGMCQFVFYIRAFPSDKFQLKALVSIVFILDGIQTFVSTWCYYDFLILCRSNMSPNCTIYVPAVMLFGLLDIYATTFIVQCFYVHRVWIISGKNRVMTTAVLLSAVAQMALGTLCTVELIRNPTWLAVATINFTPMAAVAGAVCDTLITVSIVYYLRPARTGRIRRGNHIKRLNAVFVEMGFFTVINAVAMAIMYFIQTSGVSQFLTAAPGSILGKTYTNNMLSVLNARKSIREEREAEAERPMEVPTIPTIQ